MRLTVFRTKMCGGGHSYAVYVPRETVAHADRIRSLLVASGGAEYVDLLLALMPAAMHAMPCDSRRWDAVDGLRPRAAAMAENAIALAFPDTRDCDSSATVNVDLCDRHDAVNVDGLCPVCNVDCEYCPTCHGVGYHAPDCAE